jgi:hypothetical protein
MWRKSHSGWVTSLSLLPNNVKKDWDVCSWWWSHVVSFWFWVWILCTGFVDVDCSWDLSLGHRIGDGKFDGKSFWVGCGWVFFVGRRGEEETPDHVQWGRFSFDDTCFQTVPFFMLYIIYWTVGVSLNHVSDHRERCPRSSITWSDTCVVEVSTTWQPLPRTEENVRTWCTSFHHGTPRNSWYGVLLICNNPLCCPELVTTVGLFTNSTPSLLSVFIV